MIIVVLARAKIKLLGLGDTWNQEEHKKGHHALQNATWVSGNFSRRPLGCTRLIKEPESTITNSTKSATTKTSTGTHFVHPPFHCGIIFQRQLLEPPLWKASSQHYNVIRPCQHYNVIRPYIFFIAAHPPMYTLIKVGDGASYEEFYQQG